MTVDVEARLMLRVLGGMAERLAAAPGLNTVCDAVLPALADALGAEVAALVLRDGESTLRVVATVGLSEGVRAPWTEFDLAAGVPLAAAVRESRDVWIPDVEAGRVEFPALPLVTTSSSLCSIPLRSGGSVIGAVGLAWQQPQDFDDRARQMLSTAAGLAAAACAGHVLPPRDRLLAHEHETPDGISIACLSGSGDVRCGVHRLRSEARSAQPALFATLLAAEPARGARTRDAVAGVLALARRRRTPPAHVRLAVAELAADLDGPVAGAHLEISSHHGWVAATALDEATLVLTRPAGGTPPRDEARFVGEHIAVAPANGLASTLVVTLQMGAEPEAADTIRELAEVALAAPGPSALTMLSRFAAALDRTEMAPLVRGALAVIVEPRSSPTGSAPTRDELEAVQVGQVIGGGTDGARHLVDGDGTPLCGTTTAGIWFKATEEQWADLPEAGRCRVCGFLLA
ncbi:MAG TPA: GAF domain-containing protein [Frankiaceae bacterium]|nr:GAF domain-containing protein [Frankiaceae bacterium]